MLLDRNDRAVKHETSGIPVIDQSYAVSPESLGVCVPGRVQL